MEGGSPNVKDIILGLSTLVVEEIGEQDLVHLADELQKRIDAGDSTSIRIIYNHSTREFYNRLNYGDAMGEVDEDDEDDKLDVLDNRNLSKTDAQIEDDLIYILSELRWAVNGDDVDIASPKDKSALYELIKILELFLGLGNQTK